MHSNSRKEFTNPGSKDPQIFRHKSFKQLQSASAQKPYITTAWLRINIMMKVKFI